MYMYACMLCTVSFPGGTRPRPSRAGTGHGARRPWSPPSCAHTHKIATTVKIIACLLARFLVNNNNKIRDQKNCHSLPRFKLREKLSCNYDTKILHKPPSAPRGGGGIARRAATLGRLRFRARVESEPKRVRVSTPCGEIGRERSRVTFSAGDRQIREFVRRFRTNRRTRETSTTNTSFRRRSNRLRASPELDTFRRDRTESNPLSPSETRSRRERTRSTEHRTEHLSELDGFR